MFGPGLRSFAIVLCGLSVLCVAGVWTLAVSGAGTGALAFILVPAALGALYVNRHRCRGIRAEPDDDDEPFDDPVEFADRASSGGREKSEASETSEDSRG